MPKDSTRTFTKISVVTTLYQSASFINEFYQRTIATLTKLGLDYEIVFVNDGSPDHSLDVAIALHRKDEKVVVVDLSRNFGHHPAMMTGLRHASGDAIFLIDVDLEEAPELLEDFYHKLVEEEEVDLVYGVQTQRKGDWWERFSGELYYRVVNSLCDRPIPINLLTIRIMTRRYMDALSHYYERQFTFSALNELTGFERAPIEVKKKSRDTTSYSFIRKFRILVDSITSSSHKPLYAIFYTGLSISLLSFLYILNIVYKSIFMGYPVEGWPSLIVSIWFIGGILSSFMGIIGIYISKIYIETKARPYVHIKKIYGG